MEKYKFKIFFLVVIILIVGIILNFNKESYAISSEIDPSTWYYVDGLGRTGSSNITKSEKVRLVGMFYWTWHLELNSPGPFNLNNIVKEYPNVKNDYNSSVWQQYNAGTNGSGYYWWNEPLLGYYRENDDYVLRKHAELLADAGVDFIVLDCTNGSFTWESAYENLLEVWMEAKENGVKVPKVAFMFPFGYTADTSGVSFMSVYNNLYNPSSSNFNKYHSLLFDYNGKYLVLMNDYEKASDDIKNILKNFEVRKNYPAYFTTGAKKNGSWGWLSTYPQAYYKKANGEAEQISVGVSMNASYTTNKITAMNGEDIMGRSYAKGDYSYSYMYRNSTINIGSSVIGDTVKYTNTSYYGRNFQQQWDYALSIDPEVVFVTGWNEWLVSRFENWEGTTNAFPDQFNDEYSRDIEPSNGELKDHYYYQLVDNIRKYKGTTEVTSQDNELTISSLSDWEDDDIISYNHYVGGKNRDIIGFGTTNPVNYVNNTFRNDIKTAKVSYDNSYIYFYVETTDNLSDMKDEKWMRLLIDTIDSTNSSSTENWEEFEYIVNRNSINDNKMVLEKSIGGWNFEVIGEIEYMIGNNMLSLKIPRLYLGLIDTEIKFNFKWCDNNLDNGDIMSVYTNGDSAPGGRFAFHFEGSSLYEEIPSIEFDSSLKVDNNNKYIFVKNDNVNILNLLQKVKINASNISVSVFSSDDILKENASLVVTGDKLVVYEESNKEEYIILILGDVNGDGLVNNEDTLKLYNHIRGKTDIDDIYIVSSDVNGDGKIKIGDVAKIYQYSRGKFNSF